MKLLDTVTTVEMPYELIHPIENLLPKAQKQISKLRLKNSKEKPQKVIEQQYTILFFQIVSISAESRKQLHDTLDVLPDVLLLLSGYFFKQNRILGVVKDSFLLDEDY